MEHINGQMANAILANMKMIKKMVLECLLEVMERNMKVFNLKNNKESPSPHLLI